MCSTRRAALLSLLFLPAAFTRATAATPTEPTPDETAAEAAIASRIDSLRAELAPNSRRLRPDSALARIARTRSKQLSLGAPFSHQDFEGRFPAVEMVQAAFGTYGYIGENIAMEQRGDGAFDADAFAERMVGDWMKSEGHRGSILSPNFDASGIGVVLFNNQAFATQIFRGAPPPVPRARPARPQSAGSGTGF